MASLTCSGLPCRCHPVATATGKTTMQLRSCLLVWWTFARRNSKLWSFRRRCLYTRNVLSGPEARIPDCGCMPLMCSVTIPDIRSPLCAKVTMCSQHGCNVLKVIKRQEAVKYICSCFVLSESWDDLLAQDLIFAGRHRLCQFAVFVRDDDPLPLCHRYCSVRRVGWLRAGPPSAGCLQALGLVSRERSIHMFW